MASAITSTTLTTIATTTASAATTTTPPTEDLVLFKSICADFEDIHPHDLHDTFSKYLQRPYLSPIIPSSSSSSSSPTSSDSSHPDQHATPTPMIAHEKVVRGIVWGASLRLIICLSVQITESILTLSGTRFPINVHFLYLAASPQTYLSEEALRALGIEDMVVVGEHSISPMASTPLDPGSGSSPFSNSLFNNTGADGYGSDGYGSDEYSGNGSYGGNGSGGNGSGGGSGGGGRNDSYSSSLLRLPLRINGYTTMVARSPADGHFSHLNILGQDFVQLSGANVYFGGQIPRFEISFR